jgi:hypothetical protein
MNKLERTVLERVIVSLLYSIQKTPQLPPLMCGHHNSNTIPAKVYSLSNGDAAIL